MALHKHPKAVRAAIRSRLTRPARPSTPKTPARPSRPSRPGVRLPVRTSHTKKK